MSLLGRPMEDSIIIDNSPNSYAFHQENALPILSWYDDPQDKALYELIPLLENLADVDDIRKYIPQFVTTDHRVDFARANFVLSTALRMQKEVEQEDQKEEGSREEEQQDEAIE